MTALPSIRSIAQPAARSAVGVASSGFEPSSRTDLVLWPKITLGKVWKDTSGTQAAVVGDTVSAITDSKTGALWVVSGTPPTLTQDSNGRLYLPATACRFTAPTFTIDRQSMSVYWFGKATNKTTQMAYVGFGTSVFNIYQSSGQIQVFHGSNQSFSWLVRQREFPMCLAVTSSASAIKGYSVDSSLSVNATTSSTMTTGSLLSVVGGSFVLAANFYEMIVCNTAHNDATVAQFNTYLQSRQPTYSRANLCVCVGDSRTWGLGATDVTLDYPGRLTTNLGATWEVANLGINGATTLGNSGSGIPALASVDSLYSASRTRNVLVVWAGVNANWGDYTDYRTWIQARIAAGWQVIVCTDLYGTGKNSASRTTYNTNIRNNTGDGYTVADLAATSGIGADGDITGANFTDQLHLSNAGYGVVEPVVRTAINP